MIGQIIFDSGGFGANRNMSGKLSMKLAIVKVVSLSSAKLLDSSASRVKVIFYITVNYLLNKNLYPFLILCSGKGNLQDKVHTQLWYSYETDTFTFIYMKETHAFVQSNEYSNTI